MREIHQWLVLLQQFTGVAPLCLWYCYIICCFCHSTCKSGHLRITGSKLLLVAVTIVGCCCCCYQGHHHCGCCCCCYWGHCHCGCCCYWRHCHCGCCWLLAFNATAGRWLLPRLLAIGHCYFHYCKLLVITVFVTAVCWPPLPLPLKAAGHCYHCKVQAVAGCCWSFMQWHTYEDFTQSTRNYGH